MDDIGAITAAGADLLRAVHETCERSHDRTVIYKNLLAVINAAKTLRANQEKIGPWKDI